MKKMSSTDRCPAPLPLKSTAFTRRTFSEHPPPRCCTLVAPDSAPTETQMANNAPDYANLTRICEFTRRLHQLHRLGGEDAIDQEFSAVCRSIWGFTLDDFTDDDLSAEDHAWLDELTRGSAIDFAAEQGYDLRDTSMAGASPAGGASRG
jgi:hypothetical protein